jgi:hypothetical protein
LASKSYGRAYGVQPSKWGVHYADTIKGGGYKIEDSAPHPYLNKEEKQNSRIILHNKNESKILDEAILTAAASTKLPKIRSPKNPFGKSIDYMQ